MVMTPYGAHIMAYTPARGTDILWLSPQTRMAEGMPIRGGIPLCLPWFGPHPDNFPMHGFARLSMWNVDAITCNDDGTTGVSLSLRDSAPSRDMWPHAFLFRLDIVVGTELTLSFSAQNLSQKPAAFAFAFHTYFAIGELGRTIVNGLDNMAYIDRLDDGKRKQEAGPIVLGGEIQRLYGDVGDTQSIASPRGTYTITGTARCALVWNPGTNDAGVPDIGANRHKEFVCVERLDAVDWAVTLSPEETYTTRMTLSSS